MLLQKVIAKIVMSKQILTFVEMIYVLIKLYVQAGMFLPAILTIFTKF